MLLGEIDTAIILLDRANKLAAGFSDPDIAITFEEFFRELYGTVRNWQTFQECFRNLTLIHLPIGVLQMAVFNVGIKPTISNAEHRRNGTQNGSHSCTCRVVMLRDKKNGAC